MNRPDCDGVIERLEPLTGVVVLTMSLPEAERCVERIKTHLIEARTDLIDLYEREGWRVLGYASWRDCVTVEFGKHQSYLYRLLNAGLIERELSPNGETGLIPEGQLRPLTALDNPTLVKAAWSAAQSSGEKVTAQIVQQAVKAAAEWANEYIVSQGHSSLEGDSLEVAKTAITERMAENRQRQTQHIAASYERQQGIQDDDKHTGAFTVVSASDRNGFVTLSAPELASVLKAGQRGNYIVYVKVEAQKPA
jgi:hypothetical protein